MKRLLHLNYYDLLGISPEASKSEIQKGYHLTKRTFQLDAMATYSLFDRNELRNVHRHIDKAYQTLMNDHERKIYDQTLPLLENPEKTPEPLKATENEKPPTSDSPPTGQRVDSFSGKTLKQLREQKGISLEEISRQTRIKQTYLQFMEDKYVAGLPHPVYFRAYLNQYATYLGLDGRKVVEHYLNKHPLENR